MTELYLNNRLCDTGRDFAVRLNRQLLNPEELNVKNAQFSYSITLPPTATNHEVLHYVNIEEAKDKFNREYNAELLMSGVRVFKGRFRLSEITQDYYRGNLYIPAPKSISDIFGGLNLNENPALHVPFTDFVASVNSYNSGGKGATPPCIFPLVLYGVLPKVPLADGSYSSKNVWDGSVRIGMQDLPPSINVIQLLRHIFEGQGYVLGGTALSDERLNKLYMSYKNAPEAVQGWNYGTQAAFSIRGSWSSAASLMYEKGVYTGRNNGYSAYGCNLLDATLSTVTIIRDPGGNVFLSKEKDMNDPYNRVWTRCQLRIPVSGFYKVRFHATMNIPVNSADSPWRHTDPTTGVQHLCCYTKQIPNGNDFENRAYDVRLLRDRGKGDFGLANVRLNGSFYYNNMPQNSRFQGDSGFDPSIDVPKYFPQNMGSRDYGTDEQLIFVDAAQDRNLVMGLQWGYRHGPDFSIPSPMYVSPCQMHVSKPARSWDVSVEDFTRLAIRNRHQDSDGQMHGYRRYGYFDSHTPNDADIPAGEDNIDFFPSDRYMIQVLNQPTNTIRRGKIADEPERSPNTKGNGTLNAIVWFDAGELLTVASVSEEGRYRSGANQKSVYGWTAHDVTFTLEVFPFRTDPEWLKVDAAGNGTADMNWVDPSNFETDTIDLVKFLPADMKTDDFIDNVCKAFNLRLTPAGDRAFNLDIKQEPTLRSNRFINLDNLASVRDHVNTPIGLPSLYKVGFTVDTEEEGYVMTGDDGGGEFNTGAIEEKTIEQRSTFSFNWFKIINQNGVSLPLPVISKHDVWEAETPYPDAMKKRFTNQPLRFWYQNGLLNDLGARFEFGNSDHSLYLAKVSDELPGLNVLNYKNQRLSILNNFFMLLISGSSHYTEVEGYLTPEQYEALDESISAMFNGDLYYIAELSGYDPTGRNKTKIKLIRKV
jgi:hypothetical protein